MSEYGNPPPSEPADDKPPAPPPYGQPPPYVQPGPPYGQQPYGQPPPYVQPGPPPYGQQPPYGQPQPPVYGEPGFGQQPFGQPPPYQPPYSSRPAIPAGVEFASMGRRFGARVIDWVIMTVVLIVLGAIIFGATAAGGGFDNYDSQTGNGAGAALAVAYFGFLFLVFVVTVGYEFVLIAVRGQTLGKQAVGIKVVREVDGQPPGWLASFLRMLIVFAGTVVCGVGQYLVYLSPFFDSSGRSQGWHDKGAKTVVIKV
jgi:uncharacterized RDD family membrane protein YckC